MTANEGGDDKFLCGMTSFYVALTLIIIITMIIVETYSVTNLMTWTLIETKT